MSRRGFLKLVAGVAAAIATPFSMASARLRGIPTTTDELVAWFERNFSCRHGFQGRWANYDPAVGRMTDTIEYVVYALMTKDSERGRRALLRTIWQTFEWKIQQHPEIRGSRLFWRYVEKISFYTYPHVPVGRLVMTFEEWEDKGRPHLGPDVVQGWDSMAWHERGGEPYDMVTIHVRIAIPALQDIELGDLPVKREGEAAKAMA